jgi:hypothetical protein
MNTTALAIYLSLGLIEFVVINSAIRSWMGKGGLLPFLLASLAVYFPIVGGISALVAAIMFLGWPWWVAGILFGGGSVGLAITAGFGALLGNVPLF